MREQNICLHTYLGYSCYIFGYFIRRARIRTSKEDKDKVADCGNTTHKFTLFTIS